MLDTGACDGHAECTLAAPELFELRDGDDIVTVRVPEPGEEFRTQALEAVDACPVRAITIADAGLPAARDNRHMRAEGST
jgi:ferredoxin